MKAVILENINKSFPVCDENTSHNEQVKGGFFHALEDVSLTIEEGGCTIIAGANGSGKSLLMSIIAGLETASSGTVKTASKAGLVFQEPDAQILGETPREDVAFGIRLAIPKRQSFQPLGAALSKRRLLQAETNARADAALAQTGLTERADFPARSLSGGEKRRLAAAGILAMDLELIIFDEPYANMDFPGVVQVSRLIQKLIKTGKTVIILTHELEKCLALASHFIVLNKGKKVFDGTAALALEQDLEAWGIRHPLRKTACNLGDLLWQ